jgi:hypothetical protein
MARNKLVDGVVFPLSDEEEAICNARAKAWADGKAVRDALAEIHKLESQETPRRLAEALPDDAGGSADGRAWLKANRDKIITERDKL